MVLDLLPFFVGVLSVVLGFTVATGGTNRKNLRWPFTIFALSVGVWAICISLFRIIEQPFLADIFAFTYYNAALFIAYGLLLFSLYYTRDRVPRSLMFIALVPTVVLVLAVTFTDTIIGSVSVEAANQVQLNKGYIIYQSLFLLFVGISLVLLWIYGLQKLRHESHHAVMAATLTICLAGGAYFNLLLPALGNYNLITIGPLFTILMVTTVFYFIARHGLFDVRQAVIRSVAYLLSLMTLAGVYLILAYLVFSQLLGQTSTADQAVINVALTLLLAFLFQPIKRFFDRLTNRLFYRDNYDADAFYATINKVLTSTTDLKTLLRRTAQVVAGTMKSEQAFFALFTEGDDMLVAGTEGHRTLPVKDARSLMELRHILVRSANDIGEHEQRMMVSHRIGLIMPLYQNELLLGFFCLGDHKTSRYTNRDIQILKNVADELVIAVQNALSVEQIKDLNAHLEQRIASATRELRKSNAQLQRLDEAKDEFISMASHQLRTPLTSIKGYVSMMMEGDVGKVSAEQKHVLNEAFVSSERMVRLISDFLNVSRLQTGKFTLERQSVDLAKLVEREIEGLEPNATARNLSFTYKKPRNIPAITVDENKIQQVIMNFADNAIYYSKEQSSIEVDLKADATSVTFTVKDTGIGVPDSEKDHLFNKFFRATNARRQRPDGTGVGLFLAKKVIDAHKGEIIFTSEEGKGSTFGFRLPLDPPTIR